MQSPNPVIQVDHSSPRAPRAPRGSIARAALVLCVLLGTASCKPTEVPRAIPPQHLTTLFAYVQSGSSLTSPRGTEKVLITWALRDMDNPTKPPIFVDSATIEIQNDG